MKFYVLEALTQSDYGEKCDGVHIRNPCTTGEGVQAEILPLEVSRISPVASLGPKSLAGNSSTVMAS